MRSTRLTVAIVALVLLGAAGCGGDDDSGGGDGGEGPVVAIFAPPELRSALQTLTTIYGQVESSNTRFDLTYAGPAQLEEDIAAAELPDIAIGTADALDRVPENVAQGQAAPFGTDAVMITVKIENPEGITDLSVFAGAPGITTGLCDAGTRCGDLSARVLLQGGVTPAPTSTEPDATALRDKIANGQLDAGLLLRTEAAGRPVRLSVVAIPPPAGFTINYEMVRTSDSAEAKEFFDWVEDSAAAAYVRAVQGLRELPEGIDLADLVLGAQQ